MYREFVRSIGIPSPYDLKDVYSFLAKSEESPDQIVAKASYATELFWREASIVSTSIVVNEIRSHLQTNHIPKVYITQRPEKLGKLQPSFNESVLATTRRLNFMHTYVRGLPDQIKAAVTGGSMGYGRFYNVRDKHYPDNSDLDMIMITDGPLEPEDLDQVARVDLGFEEADLESLNARAAIFNTAYPKGEMQVLSHKFALQDQRFDISLHFFPAEIFEEMIGSALDFRLRKGQDFDWRLKDYKPIPFKYPITYQRDFFGREYPMEVVEEDAEMGVVSSMPGFAIAGKSLVPGVYHNLCSPMFEMLVDKNNTYHQVDDFKELMRWHQRRLREQDMGAAISKSHIRYEILSPYVIKEIDQSPELTTSTTPFYTHANAIGVQPGLRVVPKMAS